MRRGDNDVLAADDGGRAGAGAREQLPDCGGLRLHGPNGARHGDQGGHEKKRASARARLGDHCRLPSLSDACVTPHHFQSSGCCFLASSSEFGAGAPPADCSGLASCSALRSAAVRVRGFGFPVVVDQSSGFAFSRSSRVMYDGSFNLAFFAASDPFSIARVPAVEAVCARAGVTAATVAKATTADSNFSDVNFGDVKFSDVKFSDVKFSDVKFSDGDVDDILDSSDRFAGKARSPITWSNR